jgi:hypothetical protein
MTIFGYFFIFHYNVPIFLLFCRFSAARWLFSALTSLNFDFSSSVSSDVDDDVVNDFVSGVGSLLVAATGLGAALPCW